MFVISAKTINDKGEVDWRYAGSADGYPWWHCNHLSASKFVSVESAERWWDVYKEDLRAAVFRDRTLDKDSIGVRKVVFSLNKKLKC